MADVLQSIAKHGACCYRFPMTSETHPDAQRLILVLQAIGEDGCEAIGLLPMPSLRHCGYSEAPRNSLAFASTGGDGVHFSLIALEDTAAAVWPVVMTVPMNFGNENLIVGADLREFLGLGIRQGYFELEQLVYKLDETVAWLDQHPDQTSRSAHHARALAAIRETFEISPWENHGPRVAELQAKFPFD